MAELPGRRLAAHDAPRFRDRAADAGADGEHDDVVVADGGTPGHFGCQSHVAVIVDDDGLAGHAFQPLRQGDRGEVDIAAGEHRAAPRIDAAGNADAIAATSGVSSWCTMSAMRPSTSSGSGALFSEMRLRISPVAEMRAARRLVPPISIPMAIDFCRMTSRACLSPIARWKKSAPAILTTERSKAC
ncbi:hypothetical protein AJ88_03030 [Mesorhizobium amorphae CCBAU 01583]|nr:hypothetical protein AJ88_03030 [Mesorhizobium amorphae CCBAU 01583]